MMGPVACFGTPRSWMEDLGNRVVWCLRSCGRRERGIVSDGFVSLLLYSSLIYSTLGKAAE